MLADVGPHLPRGPVGERVELDERTLGRAEGRIELDDGDFGAGAGALVAALARHPRAERPERSHQRLDLADAAAFLVPVLVEGEEPLLPHELLNRFGLREERFHGDLVVIADTIEELVGLRMKASRVEREDAELPADLRRHVDEHDILGAAERDRDVRGVLANREGAWPRRPSCFRSRRRRHPGNPLIPQADRPTLGCSGGDGPWPPRPTTCAA